jgi:hypothetical protein
MQQAANSANIDEQVNDLITLQLAQIADLREYAQATLAGEGTVQLERTLCRREAQRAELYRKFEKTAFRTSAGMDCTAPTEQAQPAP